MKENNFNNTLNKHIDTLRQYVPIVKRVHGPLHPEFNEVKVVFDQMDEKIKTDNLELGSEFESLRIITNNYTLPNDVCESYEAVYQMLHELDSAYNNQP